MASDIQMVFADILDRVGLVGLLRRIAASHAGLVLTMNRVLPREERSLCFDPGLVVSEPAFVSLLRLLRKDYQVVPLEELLTNPRGREGRAKVAITFDDGWEDNYRIAFPHLLEYQMPATIFACTGLLDTHGLLPEERFARLWTHCAAHSALETLLSDLKHWGMGKRQNRSLRPQKRYWAQELKRMPLTGRLLLLDHFEQRYQIPPVTARRFLTWDEVRIMLRTGLIRMGSHTSQHATLPSETDRDIRRELEDSRASLWKHTGTVPESLTYPSGMYSRRVLDLVQSAGFLSALTTRPGLVSANSRPLCIPRIAVRAAMDEMAVNRGEKEFSSSRASVYFLSSWLKSAIPAGAGGV